MPIYLAEKTKALVDQKIEEDQGSKYREWLGRVIPTISDAFDPRQGRRSHFGVSSIGDPCARKLFFNFRWVAKQQHHGRLLRLFNRGHMEEGRFIAALLTAGLQVYQQDANGHQYRLSEWGGHIGSAIDGVVIGCPDLPDPNTAILTEMKTHGDKSFKKLLKEGVKQSKPMHYAQIQVYMRKMGLPACLYIGVNKNDDELYFELLAFDPAVADMYIHRGIKIVDSDEPPVGLSDKGASWFECRYCEHAAKCYRGELPDENCRTCVYSKPLEDGTWVCRNPNVNRVITTDEQILGCEQYKMAPYYGR